MAEHQVVELESDIQSARRVGFILSQVEHQLGIMNVKDLPLSARVENALQGCMHNPAAVDENGFTLLHLLANTESHIWEA